MSKKDEAPDFAYAGTGFKVPTNRYAATRPYCQRHARAMIDIGGEKKCLACEEEKRKKEPTQA